MLSLFRALAALRRAAPALNVGACIAVDAGTDEVLAYTRTASGADGFLIVLNLGQGVHTLNLGGAAARATIAVASDMVRSGAVELSALRLNSNEGLVLRLAWLTIEDRDDV